MAILTMQSLITLRSYGKVRPADWRIYFELICIDGAITFQLHCEIMR